MRQRRVGSHLESIGSGRLPWKTALWFLAGLLAPALLTIGLTRLGNERDYVFLYLALVAALGVIRGLGPALLSAIMSLFLVDFFFVPPLYTFGIANEQDIMNLVAFATTSVLIGLLTTQRRHAEAAESALRLAMQEEEVRVLREADRLRQELLANVSHELRTPLGTILALSTAGQVASGTTSDALPVIAGEGRRLRELVDDLLSMARIQSGTLQVNCEPVRLADAVESAVERLRMRSPARDVRVSIQTDVEALADWDRLGQVLDNLLSNADRFGPSSSPIDVAVRAADGDAASVDVRDYGPGVRPELRSRIFDRFFRDGDGSGSEGTGLGLAIVKGLVEAQAGSVTLVTDVEPGACFRFSLPLAEEHG